jgi:hypothetical protein
MYVSYTWGETTVKIGQIPYIFLGPLGLCWKSLRIAQLTTRQLGKGIAEN